MDSAMLETHEVDRLICLDQPDSVPHKTKVIQLSFTLRFFTGPVSSLLNLFFLNEVSKEL
jgi:hypothetical protein